MWTVHQLHTISCILSECTDSNLTFSFVTFVRQVKQFHCLLSPVNYRGFFSRSFVFFFLPTHRWNSNHFDKLDLGQLCFSLIGGTAQCSICMYASMMLNIYTFRTWNRSWLTSSMASKLNILWECCFFFYFYLHRMAGNVLTSTTFPNEFDLNEEVN